MSDGLCRWIHHSAPDQESQGLPPHCAEVRQSLARSRRSRFSRMRRRRCQSRKMDVIPAQRQAQAGETVVWSYIVYKSRSHRDRVNAKVMKDPRMTSIMNPKALPFDGKRMIFGGFKVLVEG